jgi:hypothetical protein
MSVKSLALALLSLTVWLPLDGAVQAQTPDGRVVERDGTHVFIYEVEGHSRVPKWAEVEVNNADGSRRCEWLKKLEPKVVYRFECPVTVAVGDKIPLRWRLYKDATLEDREFFHDPVITITANYLADAKKPRPAKEGTVYPENGIIEAVDIPLPAKFEPTWYRRINKGFSMRAYENSGELTVGADALVFVDGDKTVRVPFDRITAVRWEPLDNDIANHWASVRFTNDDGKDDGIAFRDGGRLGRRQHTGQIYVTLHRAAKK